MPDPTAPVPPGVPILNGRKHEVNGGQEYAVEVSMVDGAVFLHIMTFNLATTGGAADLAALRDFKPEAQCLHAFSNAMVMAALRIAPEAGQMPPVLAPVAGDRMVALAHVASFRYLGKVAVNTPGRIDVERPDGSVYIHWPLIGDLGSNGMGVQ